MEAEVTRCPCCGNPHPSLKFKKFIKPQGEYNYYATCPSTKQPVLAVVTLTVAGQDTAGNTHGNSDRSGNPAPA